MVQDSEHRTAPDGSPAQKWQYGIVRYVHHKLLLDVNYDDGA